jgi:hypothetical protein
MMEPGYYSTEEALYYVAAGGAVFFVGDANTPPDSPVWEPRDALPEEAEPSNLDRTFAEELERSRIDRGIA